ncbi:WxL domain-containing protein [Lacticaseibacillus absianus]|uniref:WxL domain-containing protein n=1 Tax=Lacticaseibacillus absianus TaxID=2729623 RepID=UPI0015C6C6CA|nr:WxL domain-containing protein [Lacticaseibacillus absianus]
MKKGLLASLLVIPTVAMSMGTGVGVSADVETPDLKETALSKTEINVNSDSLSLTEVPTFTFRDVSVKELVTNLTTVVKLAGQEDQMVRVEDFRGDSRSWKLTADVSSIVNREGHQLHGQMNLKLKRANATDDWGEGQLTGGAIIPIGRGVSADVLDPGKNGFSGAGKNYYTVTETTLDVAGRRDIQAGKYSGRVTWTLSSVPF